MALDDECDPIQRALQEQDTINGKLLENAQGLQRGDPYWTADTDLVRRNQEVAGQVLEQILEAQSDRNPQPTDTETPPTKEA